MTDRESWLKGWPRRMEMVIMGTGLHCAGCGKVAGCITVAFSGEKPFRREPDWPFNEDTCPVHASWPKHAFTVTPRNLDPNRLPK